MADNDFSIIVKKYLEDPDFAAQLKSDPLTALAEAGIDVGMLATRLNMDMDQLKDYLQNIFNSKTFEEFEELAKAMGDTSGGA